MANTIKIKRRPASGAAGKPSSLFNGELAFNENDNILYYGYGSGVGGAASTIEQIGGSGYFAHRGGTNASGTWPISVTGNAETVTNGVYTTGNQNVGGIKRFTSQVEISGAILPHLIFKSANAGNYGNIVFDGVNYDGALQSSYISSSTGNMEIAHGQKIQLNSALEVKAANTAGNSVEYFAVFDSNPASTLTTLKSVSKSQILDDIGAATSGLDITAGSGLVGGGTLSQNRRFDIGQGDGISVSADSIAVDNTVVRTTGNQNIVGGKSFFESGNTHIIFNTADDVIRVKAPQSNDTTYYFVGLNGGGSPPSSTSADRSLISRSTSQVKSDLGLNNVENLALSGITFTAGSGLAGGGTLAANRSFDINTGDGIQIVSDAVAVDSTVVRTTGTQTIAGVKTFTNTSIFGSGIIASGTNAVQAASTASNATQFPVFTSSPSSSAQTVFTRTPSEVKTDIGLSNVTNDAQIKKVSSVTSGNIPFWNGTTGDLLANGYGVETVFVGGTGTLPRSDAIKTYVDNMISSGIATNDAMIFKGSIDCSTNPNYPAADRGWTYKVSVAGRIGGASGPVVEVNDTLICTTDGTSAGTHASVGSNWVILQTNIVDASILVTGPTSATSGNFALFDSSTGKIIKDAGFAATTVGQNLVSLTNPSAITFLKVNANNTVSTESASTFRTSLGANTVGSNIFTLTNPSSISFIRINADNTVTARSASELKTDLSLNNVENTALSTWAGSTNLTTLGTIATGVWSATTIAVNKGGTGQTSYTDGQLLIGNSTGNTLTKATLTAGTSVDITNGNGSITIGHADTSSLTGAQGSNGIASITVDGLGHVTAVTTATYLTAGTVCAAIVDCTLDGGSF